MMHGQTQIKFRIKISGLISGRNIYSFCSAVSLYLSLDYRSPFHQFRNKTFTFVTHISLSRYVIISIQYLWTCYKIQNNWIIAHKMYKQIFSGSITDYNIGMYKRFRRTILDVSVVVSVRVYKNIHTRVISEWTLIQGVPLATEPDIYLIILPLAGGLLLRVATIRRTTDTY
jgi:hypothetical protein